MGRTTTTQLKRSFCQWKLVLHQRNLSVINKFIAMSAFTVGVVEAWIKLTLGQKEKACVLKDETPLFITSTSLSLQRTDLLMNNDVNTLKTGSTTDGTFERTVTNRDWMKVIHFNHTTARPPSHYPRGLLYLSTFSFLLLFFFGLGWWQSNCFVRRLPLKNQTTEGDIYTYCRCGVRASCIKFNAFLFDCVVLRKSNHRRFFSRLLSCFYFSCF